jgi:hypothetical protein
VTANITAITHTVRWFTPAGIQVLRYMNVRRWLGR